MSSTRNYTVVILGSQKRILRGLLSQQQQEEVIDIDDQQWSIGEDTYSIKTKYATFNIENVMANENIHTINSDSISSADVILLCPQTSDELNFLADSLDIDKQIEKNKSFFLAVKDNEAKMKFDSDDCGLSTMVVAHNFFEDLAGQYFRLQASLSIPSPSFWYRSNAENQVVFREAAAKRDYFHHMQPSIDTFKNPQAEREKWFAEGKNMQATKFKMK